MTREFWLSLLLTCLSPLTSTKNVVTASLCPTVVTTSGLTVIVATGVQADQVTQVFIDGSPADFGSVSQSILAIETADLTVGSHTLQIVTSSGTTTLPMQAAALDVTHAISTVSCLKTELYSSALADGIVTAKLHDDIVDGFDKLDVSLQEVLAAEDDQAREHRVRNAIKRLSKLMEDVSNASSTSIALGLAATTSNLLGQQVFAPLLDTSPTPTPTNDDIFDNAIVAHPSYAPSRLIFRDCAKLNKTLDSRRTLTANKFGPAGGSVKERKIGETIFRLQIAIFSNGKDATKPGENGRDAAAAPNVFVQPNNVIIFVGGRGGHGQPGDVGQKGGDGGRGSNTSLTITSLDPAAAVFGGPPGKPGKGGPANNPNFPAGGIGGTGGRGGDARVVLKADAFCCVVGQDGAKGGTGGDGPAPPGGRPGVGGVGGGGSNTTTDVIGVYAPEVLLPPKSTARPGNGGQGGTGGAAEHSIGAKGGKGGDGGNAIRLEPVL